MSNDEHKQKNDLLCKYIEKQLIMCGYNKQQLAVMLHISLASIYNKLKNPDKLTRKEMQIIFYKLKFTSEEILQVI